MLQYLLRLCIFQTTLACGSSLHMDMFQKIVLIWEDYKVTCLSEHMSPLQSSYFSLQASKLSFTGDIKT